MIEILCCCKFLAFNSSLKPNLIYIGVFAQTFLLFPPHHLKNSVWRNFLKQQVCCAVWKNLWTNMTLQADQAQDSFCILKRLWNHPDATLCDQQKNNLFTGPWICQISRTGYSGAQVVPKYPNLQVNYCQYPQAIESCLWIWERLSPNSPFCISYFPQFNQYNEA